MSQANLSQLEGDLYPSSSFVPRLAEVLGVSALWLADGRHESSKAAVRLPTRPRPEIEEIIRMMESTDDTGRKLILGGARAALAGHTPEATSKKGRS